jgi:alcohol dehydrogenase
MTRLVDTVTTPMLLGLFATGSIRASELITHGRPINAGLIVQRADFVPEFPFREMEKAYAMFQRASEHSALKILISV